MRTFGFVLIGIGVLVIYLAWTGKLGPAFQALVNGKAPTATTPSSGTSPGGGQTVLGAVSTPPPSPPSGSETFTLSQIGSLAPKGGLK